MVKVINVSDGVLGGEDMLARNFENLSFESLSGFEKAGILFNYLGPAATKKFFNLMDDSDIKKVLVAMAKHKIIPVSVTKEVLEDFFRVLSESDSYIFPDISRQAIVEAVGEGRAHGLIPRRGLVPSRSLESLEVVDTASLSKFLSNEHPQTVSVVLAHLDSERRGRVLQSLPESFQVEVVRRLSSLEHISPEVVSDLDQLLKQELSKEDSILESVVDLGGIQSVADMLNAMDEEAQKVILSRLAEEEPSLADEVHKKMFVFEDLVKANDLGIQILLREIPNNQLLLALKVASNEMKEKIFKNLSQRAEKLLKEDLEDMGPSRLSNVEAAQGEIVDTARRLEESGQIFVAREGAKNAVV